MVETLTPREQEVLILLARGMSDQEIAEQIHVSTRTVRSHTHAILAKMGVKNRTHAVRIGIEMGLVDMSAELPDQSLLILLKQVQYIRKQVEGLEVSIVGLMRYKE